jgi:hypothetical protein
MQTITTIGLDIAKSVFQVHGVDAGGQVVNRTTASVKVCGCRPRDGDAADARGRRPQTSRGGKRGRCGEAARQMLWGF